MFLLAFHAFLRIGEITVNSRNKSDSVVQLGGVSISNTGIVWVMSQFEQNTSIRPVTLSILSTKDIHILSKFLKVRGPAKGPQFAFANASPVCVRFISPMYVALQPLHAMEYTHSHICCSSTLSIGLTSDLLMVLWGFIAVFTLYFFMLRDVVSDIPWTYGSTTMPLPLSFSTVFFMKLSSLFFIFLCTVDMVHWELPWCVLFLSVYLPPLSQVFCICLATYGSLPSSGVMDDLRKRFNNI